MGNKEKGSCERAWAKAQVPTKPEEGRKGKGRRPWLCERIPHLLFA